MGATGTDRASSAIENALAHYGVLGMKWGVRKDRSMRGPTPSVIKKGRSGKKIKTTGGKGHPHSEDAIRTSKIKRQAKKSSTDSLSNEEFRDLLNRMNMDQQYANISGKKQTSQGNKFAKQYLKSNEGKKNLAKAVAVAVAPIAVGQTIKRVPL